MYDNIIELECAARKNSVFNHVDPSLVFTNFDSAFPSPLHDWLFLVLDQMGIPEWIIKLFLFLYCNAFAQLAVLGKATSKKIFFRRGIRQGGTESGVFFVLGLDPLLRWLNIKAGKPEDTMNVYADDCGFALRSLKASLIRMFKAFQVFAMAVGLHLNPKNAILSFVAPFLLKKFVLGLTRTLVGSVGARLSLLPDT